MRFIAASALVVAVWFAGLAAFTVLAEPDRNVNVFGVEPDILRALAGSNVRLLASGNGFIRVRGERAGFVRQLYAGGAWLVLPGSSVGCMAPGNPQTTPTRMR